ncbi:MAG: hypothetical protein QOJ29_1834 [Thermoleophilaceae bacterium]|jgi:glycosyltransferase involved in cell wall biosynthesis|nr:hypothetical protein [Thermoleophilaceae bacterium]
MLDVAIHCGAAWGRWSPLDIAWRGLGGSETAAVRIAATLTARGYEVTVFGECEDARHGGVRYRDWRAFDPERPLRCVIGSRDPELFDDQPAARLRILWLHDADYAGRLTAARADCVDRVAAVSRWQATALKAAHPYLDGKICVVGNGIVHADFAPRPWAGRKPWVVYSSSPYRGLLDLLDLWPDVHARVPDAELHHCRAAIYERLAERSAAAAEVLRRVADRTAACPGVVAHGGLSQPKLASLLCRSRVWAHPSFSALTGEPWLETSCIAAIEAQAAGCAVVASAWGALPEVVKAGALVSGPPRSARWRRELVEQIVAGLTDAAVGATAVANGPPAVRDMSWTEVGRRFAGLLALSPTR